MNRNRLILTIAVAVLFGLLPKRGSAQSSKATFVPIIGTVADADDAGVPGKTASRDLGDPLPRPGTVVPPNSSVIEPVVPEVAKDRGTTLSELTFLAQTTNPALREASARVGVAQGNAIQVGLPPNPFFFVSSPQLAGSISQYNVVFGQDVVTAGKLRLNRAAAYRSVEQSQLDFARTRFAVLTNVRRQFYVTAIAQRRTEVLEQLVRTTGRSSEVGKNLLKAGQSNIADANLLDIEYDKARLAYQSSLAILEAARKQLAAVVGVPGQEIGLLEFDLSANLPEYEHEALRLGVIDRNALAAIAAVDIQKMQLQLRRAVVEPYPNFNIQAGYQYGTLAPLHNQGYGQFTSSLPVWDRNQGGIRAAQADTVRAVATVERVENELSQQTAAALGDYSAASARATIYAEQILPKAREVYRSNTALFEQGQSGFLILFQSQRTLIEADLGYVDAQEARWNVAITVAGLLQIEQFP
jgi:cobalt-zinc-cadmium efflux system outer membrane protein